MRKKAAILFYILSIGLLFGCSSTEKSKIATDYENAQEYYNNGEFKKAYELLQTTQSYKNSETLRDLSYVMMMVQGRYKATPVEFTINKFDVEGWNMFNSDLKTSVIPLTKSSIKFESNDDSNPSTFTVKIDDENVTLVGDSGFECNKITK